MVGNNNPNTTEDTRKQGETTVGEEMMGWGYSYCGLSLFCFLVFSVLKRLLSSTMQSSSQTLILRITLTQGIYGFLLIFLIVQTYQMKKNHICTSQVFSNFFYGTIMKSGSRVKFIKGNMVKKKVKSLRYFSFANFHPGNHTIEEKCHN